MAVKVRARYVERAKPEAGEKAFRAAGSPLPRVVLQVEDDRNASALVDECISSPRPMWRTAVCPGSARADADHVIALP
jgi:hypothetical protein